MPEFGNDQQKLKELRTRIWERTNDLTFARMTVLERASQALASGLFTANQQVAAANEAHKLAGSLGAIGLLEECQVTQTIEHILKREGLTTEDGERLEKLLLQLRGQLADAPIQPNRNS
jgi:HPt (histidine-containing phosphotransfer) domain-containing protein